MSLEIHGTAISGLPIAPSVNKQIEMKHKTGKKQHAHTHINNTSILACTSLFRTDGQPESIIRMRTLQKEGKKNGMVEEAGELMRLNKTKQNSKNR